MFRVTIIYGWDSVARDLGLLTILGIVAKLILRHIVHVTLLEIVVLWLPNSVGFVVVLCGPEPPTNMMC